MHYTSFIDWVLLIALAFLFYKEVSSLRKDNEELRSKFNQLAEKVGEKELSFIHLEQEFKEKLIQTYMLDPKEALFLLLDKTKLNLDDGKKYLESIVREKKEC